jgi:Rps23 Pro-64 3,4-dihydroxylase Tpa1-like proline 4-hydroxylase
MAKDVLDSWLAPRYRNAGALAKNYGKAKPFPHIVLRRVFVPARAAAVQNAAIGMVKAGEFTHKDSDLFSLSQTPDLNASTNPAIVGLRQLFQSPEWRAYIAQVTGVRLSGKSLDIGGSLYLDTDFLLCHDDQVTGRKIAYIYYAGPDFTARDGGALALLSSRGKSPGDIIVRYPPQFNTLAMFTVSAKSWHAVEEVLSDKPRLSINGWFH